MLPGRDGFELTHSLRDQRVGVPILMLTARDGFEDRVRGLELGADDYLTKPFHLPERSGPTRSCCGENSEE